MVVFVVFKLFVSVMLGVTLIDDYTSTKEVK